MSELGMMFAEAFCLLTHDDQSGKSYFAYNLFIYLGHMKFSQEKGELEVRGKTFYPFLELYGDAEVPYPIQSKVEPTTPQMKVQPHTDLRRECKLVLTRQDLEQAAPKSNKRLWTESDDRILLQYAQDEKVDWGEVNDMVLGRNENRCWSRIHKLKIDPNSAWKQEEDQKLLELVQRFGPKWTIIASYFKNRNSRQIKHRYDNQLKPGVLRKEWSIEDDLMLIRQLNTHGKDWEKAGKLFPDRSQRQIKNRYYGKLKHLNEKKMKKLNGEYLPI